MNRQAVRDRAQAALDLVSVDPRAALREADRAVHEATRTGDRAAASVAERARGLALGQVGSLTDAEASVRRAVRYAERTDEDDLIAEARSALGGVLSSMGRFPAALRELDRALPHSHGVVEAYTRSRRGVVLVRAGRIEEALGELGASLTALRAEGDDARVLVTLVNRGVAHFSRGDTRAAQSDLSEAAGLAERLGHGAYRAYALANLAYVRVQQNDVVEALSTFDAAEQVVRSSGASVASLLSMRAELLVSVRLLREATEVAERALAEFEAAADRLGAADTRMLLAQIAVRAGRPETARSLARRAAADFRRLGRHDLAAFGQLWRGAAGERVPHREIETVAAAMTAAGWWLPAVEARILAWNQARTRGDKMVALTGLEEAARSRTGRGGAHLRARAWYAEALRREALGDEPGSVRAAARGLEILDEHRATLPATDLRAHFAAHRMDLVLHGLRLALHNGSSRRVLQWAERGRATHLLQRPVRPPEDPLMLELLATLRRVVGDLYDARTSRVPAVEQQRLYHRLAVLERRIRDLVRERGGRHFDPVGRPADVRDLAAALGERALIEYVTVHGDLFAISLVDGRCRLHPLGPFAPVADLLDRIPFAVQRMVRAAARPRGAGAAVTLLDDAGRRLERLLLAPIREAAGRDLVVVPTGALQALPWSVLPACAGRPVTVAPSATVWLAATRREPRPGHVVVAAGPRLPGAPGEARTVAAIHGTTALVDPDARVDAVSDALPGAGLAHLATHGRLSAENPLFSHLLLSDGPLVVYDLERLDSLPHTVVLAACDSGRHVAPAGDELLGLSTAFLARGTAQVIASVVPVPDAETTELMTALHQDLAAGRGPAEALATAQALLRDRGPVAAATAAGFVCIGAGFTPVPLSPAPSPPRGKGRSLGTQGRVPPVTGIDPRLVGQ